MTDSWHISPILERYLGLQRNLQNVDTSEIVIAFDRSDAEWLRGYCCLLRALCETVLAYDHSLFWDTVAHRLFQRGIVKHDFLREEELGEPSFANGNFILDLIAGVHNCRFKLKEPERLKIEVWETKTRRNANVMESISAVLDRAESSLKAAKSNE